MKNNIEKKLNKIRYRELSEEHKNSIWLNVRQSIQSASEEEGTQPTLLLAIKNIYMKNIKNNFIVKPAIITLLIIGLGSTAFASNSAKPGDALFVIDRALENIQLALAGSERDAELKIEFAQERILEVREIIEEAKAAASLADSTQGLTQAEVDVFTDITLVKIELNNEKHSFETSETGRDEVIDEIVANFDVTREQVEAVLNFQMENRESRPEDRPDFTDDNQNGQNDDNNTSTTTDNGTGNNTGGSIEIALSFALNFIGNIKDDFVSEGNDEGIQAIDLIIEQLNTEFEDLPDDATFSFNLKQNKNNVRFVIESTDEGGDKIRIKVKAKEDGDVKIETRDGDSRLKIEIKKNGQVKIKSKEDRSNKSKGKTNKDGQNNNDTSTTATSTDDGTADQGGQNNDDTGATATSTDDGTTDQGGQNDDDTSTATSTDDGTTDQGGQNDDDTGTAATSTDDGTSDQGGQNDDDTGTATSTDDGTVDQGGQNNDDAGTATSTDDGTADQGGQNNDDTGTTATSTDDGTADQGNQSDDSSGSSSSVKIVAKVRYQVIEVDVEIGDNRDRFEIAYTDRASLIAEIASRYDLTVEEIDAIIEFNN